jgi:hypothetical protein
MARGSLQPCNTLVATELWCCKTARSNRFSFSAEDYSGNLGTQRESDKHWICRGFRVMYATLKEIVEVLANHPQSKDGNSVRSLCLSPGQRGDHGFAGNGGSEMKAILIAPDHAKRDDTTVSTVEVAEDDIGDASLESLYSILQCQEIESRRL